MKKMAIVSYGSWTKLAVPVEKLSEFLKTTADFKVVDTGWVEDTLVYYCVDTSPTIELIDADEIVTKAEYKEMRDKEAQKMADAEA